MTVEQLLDLKTRIQEVKEKTAELYGQKTLKEKELKEDWGCGSVEEAKKELSAIEKEMDKLGAKIAKEQESIEEELNAA